MSNEPFKIPAESLGHHSSSLFFKQICFPDCLKATRLRNNNIHVHKPHYLTQAKYDDPTEKGSSPLRINRSQLKQTAVATFGKPFTFSPEDYKTQVNDSDNVSFGKGDLCSQNQQDETGKRRKTVPCQSTSYFPSVNSPHPQYEPARPQRPLEIRQIETHLFEDSDKDTIKKSLDSVATSPKPLQQLMSQMKKNSRSFRLKTNMKSIVSLNNQSQHDTFLSPEHLVANPITRDQKHRRTGRFSRQEPLEQCINCKNVFYKTTDKQIVCECKQKLCYKCVFFWDKHECSQKEELQKKFNVPYKFQWSHLLLWGSRIVTIPVLLVLGIIGITTVMVLYWLGLVVFSPIQSCLAFSDSFQSQRGLCKKTRMIVLFPFFLVWGMLQWLFGMRWEYVETIKSIFQTLITYFIEYI